MFNFKKNRWLWLSLLFYFFSLSLYAIFSYSLTAPNLVLSQHPTFWHFQSFMWRTFFNDRQLLSQIYFGLMILNFGAFFVFCSQLFKVKKVSFKMLGLILAMLCLPLLISNNALSYDVFNYIFNAKMVSFYHVDPHYQVALNFPEDPWTKFMHNTHTTAPYGHGWTYLSLIPYTIGMGKFITTWLSFRVFNLLPLFALLYFYYKNNKSNHFAWLFFVIFNPLTLIEVVSNSHNDLWMMAPAIGALLLLSQSSKNKIPWFKAIISLGIILLTMWVKIATVALLPLWLIITLRSKINIIPRFDSIVSNWPYLASIVMFLPLLTTRSQQFHPWYLLWSLTFVPLIRPNKWIKIWMQALAVLSISSMFRYLPFLWNNNYDGNVLLWQKIITFTPFVLALLFFTKQAVFHPHKAKR